MNGPSVVALGGGHGLAATLTAVSHFTNRVTAVVSVADDGGSSGRLRAANELPALGDLRKAIVALARDDSPLSRAMAHRFGGGDLDGHSLGNLLIAAITEGSGDLVGALAEVGRLVGVVGVVLPNALEPVVLCASTIEGTMVEGQVAVMGTAGVERVWLEPEVTTPPEAIAAIAEADLIVLGPGSLFTSVLACLAAPAVRDAVAASSATSVYVANLHTQVPETAGLNAAAHVDALIHHGIRPDIVLADKHAFGGSVPTDGVVIADLADDHQSVHSPDKLAKALWSLLSP